MHIMELKRIPTNEAHLCEGLGSSHRVVFVTHNHYLSSLIIGRDTFERSKHNSFL